MGTTLEVVAGLGVSIPVTGKDDLKITRPSQVEGWVNPYVGEGASDDDIDEYVFELFEWLDEKFELLRFHLSYVHGILLGGAIFVKRLSDSQYYASVSIPAQSMELALEEVFQLKAASELLGVEYSIRIIALPSLG